MAVELKAKMPKSPKVPKMVKIVKMAKANPKDQAQKSAKVSSRTLKELTNKPKRSVFEVDTRNSRLNQTSSPLGGMVSWRATRRWSMLVQYR